MILQITQKLCISVKYLMEDLSGTIVYPQTNLNSISQFSTNVWTYLSFVLLVHSGGHLRSDAFKKYISDFPYYNK